MTMFREPEAVEIARRVTERAHFAHFNFHDMTPERRDALRMAQYVLADWDQRVVAKWIDAEGRLEIRLSIAEIELVMLKDVEHPLRQICEQAFHAMKNRAEIMRARGTLSKAVRDQDPRP